MSRSSARVDLAAFAFTPELMGEVTVCQLGPAARDAWTDLVGRYRQKPDCVGNLPYSALAAALRAACKTYVNIERPSKDQPPTFLVSHSPLNAEDVEDAFTVFEQAILDVPADDIRFSYTSDLASRVAAAVADNADTRGLAEEHLRHIGLQPDAESWVWHVATWHAARQLERLPWMIDGTEVRFRTDTRGDLIVWDPELLWSSPGTDRYPTRYAALRVNLRMKTLPHLRDPMLVVDPRVMRLSNGLRAARTAWLEPTDQDAPLLVLGVARGRVDYHTRLALTVLSKLRGGTTVAFSDEELAGTPGRLRSVIPRSVRYPLGKGVGMHALRHLLTHVAATLGTAPLAASPVAQHRFKARPQRKLGRDAELLDPTTLSETVRVSGCQRLSIQVLYATAHTRRRIQNLLAFHFDRVDIATSVVADGHELSLVDGTVSVVFHDATALLEHGPHEPRAGLVAAMNTPAPDDEIRMVALCETEYDAEEWARRRRAARKDRSVRHPDEIDAKHPVNQLLAKRGVVTQFLARRSPEAASPEDAQLQPDERLLAAVKADHAGHSALGDLFRSGGLVHARIGEALSYGSLGLTAPHAFVGLHIREQRAGSAKRQLVYTLAALVPEGTSWRTLGYCWNPHPVTQRTGWRPYADANATFRSYPYPKGSRNTAHDAGVPKAIDTALAQLRHQLAGTPYVLVVGEACRSIWPGLANKHLDRPLDPDGTIDGRPPLPGPANCRPSAIVRVTPESQDIPRPVPGLELDDAPDQAPAAGRTSSQTTRRLLELHLPHVDRHVWLLANVPRQYDGAGRLRRLGSDVSRWKATPQQQRTDWYTHTATELLVVGADGDQQTFAVAAARLCDHTIAWDGRTRYPVPLHLAMQMDRDHPGYRRTLGEDDVEEVEDAPTEQLALDLG